MKVIDENLFGNNIVSGVVTRNIDIFKPHGFSISLTPKISQSYIDNCKKHFADYLTISPDKILKQMQVHCDTILNIDKEIIFKDADAMITKEKGICLTVSIADCIGILIYDPVNKVISAVHSGWQGTKLNIVGKTIDKLINEYNSNPSDLKVYMSPSASVDTYEVGEEFLNFFPKYVEKRNNKLFFDNKKAVLYQLLEKNCKLENIISSNIDTISDLEMQSYRRDKENAGRMSAYIMIKN